MVCIGNFLFMYYREDGHNIRDVFFLNESEISNKAVPN